MVSNSTSRQRSDDVVVGNTNTASLCMVLTQKKRHTKDEDEERMKERMKERTKERKMKMKENHATRN